MMVNKKILTFLLITVALFTVYYIMFYNYNEMVINRLLVDKRSVNNRLIVSRINEILFREYEPVEVELVPTGPYYSIEVTLEDTSYTIGVWPHPNTCC